MPELQEPNINFLTKLDKLSKKAINQVPEATLFPIAIFSMNELGPAVITHDIDVSIFNSRKQLNVTLQNLAITTYFPIQNTFLTGSGIIDIPIPSDTYRALLLPLPNFAIEKMCFFIPKSVLAQLPPYRVMQPEIMENLMDITHLTTESIVLMRKRILRIFTKNFNAALKL